MKTTISVLLIGILSSFTMQASAATIYSENFNDTGFQGSTLILPGSTSDNFTTPTNYYSVNNYDGWTFSGGGTYYATNGSGEGAILLNEGGAATASTTISGLTQGNQYVLQFNVSGDNRPGELYGLNVTLGGNPVLALAGVADQTQGYYNNTGGPLQSISFTATGSSEALSFTQNTQYSSQASPIIDNVSVSAVPEPTESALLLSGIGLIGFMASRRRNKV